MYQNYGVGLDWSTFFCSKEDKEDLIKRIKSAKTDQFDPDLIDSYISIQEESRWDNAFKQACKIIVLKFCLEDTSFAKDILSEEDFEKCTALFTRKQYDSKLLKNLLSKFHYCLATSDRDNHARENFNNLLKLDLLRTTKELREQEVEKTFSPLKKQIEKITAGVKGICYLETEKNGRRYHDISFKQSFNDYIETKFKYDFNGINGFGNISSLLLYSYDYRENFINRLLQKTLYDDNGFWEKHESFNVMSFVETVEHFNGSRHAEKILDHILSEIAKMQNGKSMIENSLPLVFLDREEFLFALEERTFRFTFDRFKKLFNLKTLSKNSLCYPFASINNAQEKLLQGKQIIEEFLHEIYPEDFNRILEILYSEIKKPCSAFSGREQKVCNADGDATVSEKGFDKWNMQHIFDYPTFGYHNQIVDRDAVTVYCPEYFSEENIWNRFYLKAYYMLELVKDKKTCFANLFEVYYDLFQFIEKQTGIKTSYQRDTEGRNESYIQLKSILKQYGVNISDKHKTDYIISLLDRKVAIREESERFPVLEQLGDAVYGLALAEMIFYDPSVEHARAIYNDYIRADLQIDVAKKISIDRLYLSSYSLPRKYERDILIDADNEIYVIRQESEQFKNDEKYIADSLEMIIGTICRDCGYQTAIDFTKRIFRETYPKFPEELHWENNQNSNIDRDYWTRILPAPYSSFEPSHHMLWDAFDKFFKAYVLGTEDRVTRQYITNSFGDNELYDDVYNIHYEVNKVFYEYLHKGLISTIDKFSNSVKEKYEKLKK